MFVAKPAPHQMPKWTAFQRGRNPVLGPGDGVLMSNADVGSSDVRAAARM
jgi:hypothetical protein